uniref:DNA2/NAM7 helicase-like C-terminal domain-containing protein n=1 Tax=Catagonus wagneri TaxID=51154 RepID=A0A8C3W3E9_9CETA
MLDTQYCMHESICAFLSMEFYKKKLKTWQGLRRPPSILGYDKENRPVIFGEVQSHEESLVVSTEEGRENSKVNKEQAALVVGLAKQLVSGMVHPRDIAILTAYHALVLEVSERLDEARVAGVTVCSVTKSQGSHWRYVLVSTVRTCQESEVELRPTKSWLTKTLGFVVDPNQVNVALTWAQEGPLVRAALDSSPPLAQKSIVPAYHVQVQREIVSSSNLTCPPLSRCQDDLPDAASAVPPLHRAGFHVPSVVTAGHQLPAAPIACTCLSELGSQAGRRWAQGPPC